MEKTAEEILNKNLKTEDAYWLSDEYLGKWYPEIKKGIHSAMTEYALQQKESLLKEIIDETEEMRVKALKQFANSPEYGNGYILALYDIQRILSFKLPPKEKGDNNE